MRPCENLVGKSINGTKRTGLWHVRELVKRNVGASGGSFSIGYKVEHDDGTQAFLKATDIGLLKDGVPNKSPLEKMRDALSEQQFEREILDICRGNNMDRIVHALDFGEFETTEGGVRDYVFYIMFEMATGDVRQQVSREKRRDLLWATHALHNLSVAIEQLHSARIAHNDVKPSNLLIFEERLQKLADLGRATADEMLGPWDQLNYTGDLSYAAPEFWYHNKRFPRVSGKINFDVRRASDLYLLGSMGFFFIAGAALTPTLRSLLRPEHNPFNWAGTFDEALPYIREAFGRALELMDAEFPRDNSGNFSREVIELRSAICQLCDPDPSTRGHPHNVQSGDSQYSVRRYVTLFDRLAKALAVGEKRFS